MNFDDMPIGGGKKPQIDWDDPNANPFGGSGPPPQAGAARKKPLRMVTPKEPQSVFREPAPPPEPEPEPRQDPPAPSFDSFLEQNPEVTPSPSKPKMERKMSQKAMNLLGLKPQDIGVFTGAVVDEEEAVSPRGAKKGPPAGLAARLAAKNKPKPQPDADEDSLPPPPSMAPPKPPAEPSPFKSRAKASIPIIGDDAPPPQSFAGDPDPVEEAPKPAPKPAVRRPPPRAAAPPPSDEENPFASKGGLKNDEDRGFGGGGGGMGGGMGAGAGGPSGGDDGGGAGGAALSGNLDADLQSKDWKVRNSAAMELKKRYDLADDGKSPVFFEFTGLFKKLVVDTNAAAQSSALKAIKVYMERCDNPNGTAEDVIPGLISKCLGGRPDTKTSAIEILLLYIEAGCIEPVLTNLSKGYTDKQFKIAQACGEAITQALKEFGPKVIPIKEASAAVNSLYQHTNGAVRKQALDLACENYRWLRDVFLDQVKNSGAFKPAQIKEMEDAFANIPAGNNKPSRRLRSEANKPQKAGGKGGKGGKEQKEEESFNPLDLIEAADVLKGLSEDWEEKTLAAPKWKDKKEQLDALLALLNSPKIKYTERIASISKTLIKLCDDSNIAVVSTAVKAMLQFATGCRKEYKDVARGTLKTLLDLLKEKKPTVNQPVNATLDMYFEIGLELVDMIPAFEEAMASKVPQIREQTGAFIVRCLKSPHCKPARLNAAAKPLGDLMLKSSDDSAGDVRAAALHAIGLLLGHLGKRPLHALITKLEGDKKKYSKVEEHAKEVAGGAGDDGGAAEEDEPAAPPPRKNSVSAPAKRPGTAPKKAAAPPPEDDDGDSAPPPARAAPPKRPATAAPAKKPAAPAAKPAAAAKPGGKPAAGGKKGADDDNEDYSAMPGMAPEMAKEKLAEFIGGSLEMLESKKWNERNDCVAQIKTKVTEAGDGASDYTDGIVYGLAAVPGFKDSNAQVLVGIFQVYGALAASASNFHKKHAYLAIAAMVPKMGDRKIATGGAEVLTQFAESCGPKFVLSELNKQIKALKAPTAIVACVKWVVTAVDEFGLGSFNPHTLIDFGKSFLENSNKPVRDAATELLVAIYKQTGDVMKDKLLDGLKPALATAIQDEFSKVEVGSVQPTRAVKGAEAPAAPISLDELVPRTDISPMIKEKLLEKMNDANWKLRKEAMDEINGILAEASHRIGPKDGGVLSALKGRLDDKNLNLVKVALELVESFANDMGPPIAKYAGNILVPVMTNLANTKKPIVEAAAKTLKVWIANAGVASVVKYLPKALADPKGRKDLLTVVVEGLENNKSKEKMEWDEMVQATFACLQDKTGDVRTLAEKLLVYVIRGVGFNAVKAETTNLAKAVKLALDPILEKARAAAAEKAAASKQAAAEDEPPEDDEDEKRPGRPAAKGAAAARSRSKGPEEKKSAGRPSKAAPPPEDEEEEEESAPPPKSASKAAPAAKVNKLAAAAKIVGVGGAGKKGEVVDEGPLLKGCDKKTKAKRVDFEARKLAGSYRYWADDEIQELNDFLREYCAETLHKNLFNKDFQLQIKAIDALRASGLSNFKDETYSVIDQIFKYMGWRMIDANTSVLLKALEYLEALFEMMGDEGIQLHDGEALNLLPFLINEVLGHAKVQFRDSSRKIIRLACNIYPASKVFQLLFDSLKNKNKRTTSECLDEMGEMLVRLGLNLTKPDKTLPEVMKYVGNSDNGIRSSALGCLAKVYQTVGENVWKYLGGKDGGKSAVPAKARDLLVERFKRTKVEGPKAAEAPPTPSKPAAPAREAKEAARPASAAPAPVAAKKPLPNISAGLGSRSKSAVPPPQDDYEDEDNDGGSQDDQASPPEISPPITRPNTFNNNPSGHYVDASAFDLEFDSIGQPPSSLASTMNITQPLPHGSYGMAPVHSSAHHAAPAHSAPSSASYSILQSRLNAMATVSAPSQMAPSPAPRSSPPAMASPAFGNSNDFDLTMGALGDNSEMLELVKRIDASGDENERIEAMRIIWQNIKKTGASIVQPHTDVLVAVLVQQINASFLPHIQGQGLRVRLCKYALNLLLEIFQDSSVAEDMHVQTHEKLSRELLSHLVNVASLANTSDAGRHVVKSLNILMLKILENADRTSSFYVLLRFLTLPPPPIPVLNPPPAEGAFYTLVVKCLLKITKALSTTIDALRLDIIIKAIHEFFVANPRSQISDPRNNTVFRAVRTTLNEIVKLKRDGILEHLTLIPRNSDIHYWIQQSLSLPAGHGGDDEFNDGPSHSPVSSSPLPNQHHAPMQPVPSASPKAAAPIAAAAAAPQVDFSRVTDAVREKMGGLSRSASVEKTAAQAGALSPRSANQAQALSPRAASSEAPATRSELEQIFEKLHRKETTQEALRLLYHYKNGHPDFQAEVAPFLARTSEVFQNYIQRGLKRVEDQERANAAAGLDAPAPASVSVSSSSSATNLAGINSADDYKQRLAALTGKTSASATPLSQTSGAPLSSNLSQLSARLARISAGDRAEAGAPPPQASSALNTSALDRIRQRFSGAPGGPSPTEFVQSPALSPTSGGQGASGSRNSTVNSHTSLNVAQPPLSQSVYSAPRESPSPLSASSVNSLPSTTTPALSGASDSLARIRSRIQAIRNPQSSPPPS